jgi:peptide deformylase
MALIINKNKISIESEKIMIEIITDIEKLVKPSEPLTFMTEEGAKTEEGTEIIDKIKAAMEENKDILALSAPQIGIEKRIFCLRFNDQIKTFINPIITKKRGMNITIETCASMPGKEIVIGRPEEITVVYYNDKFDYEDNKLLGVAASLFDQQAQILDGILPNELGLVSDIKKDGKIEDEDLQEIIPFYKDTFLPSRLTSLKEAIESNEEAKKEFKYLKFTEEVINGRIEVVESEDEVKNRIKAKKAANKTIANMKAAEKAMQKSDFNKFVSKVSKNKHK